VGLATRGLQDRSEAGTIIKDLIGHRLDPRWIRKGGYESIEEAAQDLIAQIRAHCVVGGAAVSPSKPLPVTLDS